MKKSGFTLLEIIIVIIVVGVLASLALPRFFKVIEVSRGAEALNAFSVLRKSIERYYVARLGDYTGVTFSQLDVEDPGNLPATHFTYNILGANKTGYSIVASRNALDNGSPTSTLTLTQTVTSVSRSGTPAFIGIQ